MCAPPPVGLYPKGEQAHLSRGDQPMWLMRSVLWWSAPLVGDGVGPPVTDTPPHSATSPKALDRSSPPHDPHREASWVGLRPLSRLLGGVCDRGPHYACAHESTQTVTRFVTIRVYSFIY